MTLRQLRNEFSVAGQFTCADGYPLFIWRTPDGIKVDFLCETASGYTAIEVKAATGWRPAASRGPARLSAELRPKKVRCYGVYLGAGEATYEPCRVFPVIDFLRRLGAGEIIG